MKVSVWASPLALTQPPKGVCLVLDVLRATTVMLTALENGAAWIRPVAETDQALSLAGSLSPRPLLGGERKALRIPGFDFGNSPLEYTREIVAGRGIVMTTTNGTRALGACGEAEQVYAVCMRNAAAGARALAQGTEGHILCAGTAGRFTLEDGLCAGAILDRLPDAQPDDLGQAMMALYRAYRREMFSLLRTTAHTGRLLSLGMEEDIHFCLEEDTTSALPLLQNGLLNLTEAE